MTIAITFPCSMLTVSATQVLKRSDDKSSLEKLQSNIMQANDVALVRDLWVSFGLSFNSINFLFLCCIRPRARSTGGIGQDQKRSFRCGGIQVLLDVPEGRALRLARCSASFARRRDGYESGGCAAHG